MKKLFTIIAFIATCVTAYAQSLDIVFQDGEKVRAWENNFPIKEVRNISHSEDYHGRDLVKINLKSGPTYSYDKESIQKIVSTPGEDLSKYSNGDLLGITNEMDFDVDTTFVNAIYPKESYYLYLNIIGKLLNTTLRYSGGWFTPYILHYHVYDIDYVSTDIDGEKIRLSGRVIYPYSVYGGEADIPLQLNNVFLENHYTTLQKSQAPTVSFENTIMSGMACKGYLVVQPDYLGLGSSDKRTQLFIDYPIQSRNVVDCVLATMHLKDFVNQSPKYCDIPLADNAMLLNEGCSQGASVAVGVHRFIENELTPEEQAIMPVIQETRACSGVYDLFYTLDKYAEWDSVYFAGILPVMVEGVCVGHEDLLKDDSGNQITVNDLFNTSMNETRFPDYGNMTIFEMVNSKQYGAWDLTYPLFDTYGSKEDSYASFSKMMNPDIIADGHLNMDNPYVKAIKNALELSNNTTGWAPQAPLKIWHGKSDRIAPYENSTRMYDNLLAENPDANITFSEIIDDKLGDHISVCGYWMLAELLGVDISTILSVLDSLSY